jgi:hypothetical protein
MSPDRERRMPHLKLLLVVKGLFEVFEYFGVRRIV